MFHHINGKITDIEPGLVAVECAGIGFALNATANTISSKNWRERRFIRLRVRPDGTASSALEISAKRSFEMWASRVSDRRRRFRGALLRDAGG